MKILIVTPDPDKSGGVANYYKTLSGSFSYDVDYFIMGSRTDKDGIVGRWFDPQALMLRETAQRWVARAIPARSRSNFAAATTTR